MKKIILILLTVALFSCTSLPDPQETNKGIVVFAHEMDNKANIDIFAYFSMTIKGVGNNKIIKRSIPKKSGIVKFFLEPGTYKISELQFVYDHIGIQIDCNKFIENTGEFSVKKGEIIILNNVLKTHTKHEIGKGWIYYNVVDASNKDLTSIRNQIKGHKGSKMWEVDGSTMDLSNKRDQLEDDKRPEMWEIDIP